MTAINHLGGEATINRFLAALHPTRKERALSWLVGRCYARNEVSGAWNWLGDRADDLRVWLQNRRADKSVGWSRLATVGRKVSSADGTSTPPHHLPPLPDECPPDAVPLMVTVVSTGPQDVGWAHPNTPDERLSRWRARMLGETGTSDTEDGR